MSGSLNHELSSLTIRLILADPFFGHLLSGLIKIPAPVGGVAIGLRERQLVLLIDEEWLSKDIPFSRRLGAFRHELLHLLFRHPVRIAGVEYPALFHLAADLVVNQYLSPEELPGDALLPAQFPFLRAEGFPDTRRFYRQLSDAWGQLPSDEDPPFWAATAAAFFRGDHPALERHRRWPGGDSGPDSGERRLLEGQIAYGLEQAAGRCGKGVIAALPPALQQLLPGGGESLPAVDWRRTLHLFASGSRRTRLKHSIRRPSKRYGTAPGLKIRRLSRLLVAVDTSASVKAGTLAVFFDEIHRLWLAGGDITIVECDTVIRKRYAYEGRRPDVVTGRGGTLFDAPIELARRELRPDGIIYFTDGQGPPPAEPAHCPLLWIVDRGDAGLQALFQNTP